MTKREIAENYFKQGYNCAQSVVLTFSKEINLDEKTALMLASPFGGGMGRLRETCGAVSGMLIVLGLLKGYSSFDDIKEKTELYSLVQKLVLQFKEKNGSYTCRELLNLPDGNSNPVPEKRTETYYKKRPCALLVGDATEILDNYLNNN